MLIIKLIKMENKILNCEYINPITLGDFRKITDDLPDDAVVGVMISNGSGVIDGTARVIEYSPVKNVLLIMNKPIK